MVSVSVSLSVQSNHNDSIAIDHADKLERYIKNIFNHSYLTVYTPLKVDNLTGVTDLPISPIRYLRLSKNGYRVSPEKPIGCG